MTFVYVCVARAHVFNIHVLHWPKHIAADAPLVFLLSAGVPENQYIIFLHLQHCFLHLSSWKLVQIKLKI